MVPREEGSNDQDDDNDDNDDDNDNDSYESMDGWEIGVGYYLPSSEDDAMI